MALPAPLQRRAERLLASAVAPPAPLNLASILFPQQLPFALDQARYQTAVTPRRAGKTYAIAAKLLAAAERHPGSTALYVTLSRLNAKRIVWSILKGMARDHGLQAEAAEGDLRLGLPNGSAVMLSGASDRSEVDKFRGLALSLAVIDEAQSFPAYLSGLIDEVLAPALTDYAGAIALVGTPGPVPVGYFYDRCQSPEWAHHTWSVFDNVHLARKSGRTTESLLEDELRRRGVDRADPVIQREWFGRWVLDANSLVFRFDLAKNTRQPVRHQHHVIGVDFGFDDADAIAVLGWSDDSPSVDVVEEWVQRKQTISALTSKLTGLYERYQPLALVADTGALGKKIAEEIQQRTGLPVEPAEKDRKLEHIELVNDALRTGRLYAPRGSRFAQDCQMVEWDRTNPEKPKVSARFHSDITDAVLYAYRRCLAWLHVPEKAPPPPRNTEAWYEAQARQAEEEQEAYWQQQMQNHRQQQEEEKELAWL